MPAEEKKEHLVYRISERVKETIADLIDRGVHIDAAKTTTIIAKQLGLKDRWINVTHTEVRNRLNEIRFRKIPYRQRVLFVPQCLRNSATCRAVMDEEGWHCRNCGSCKIPTITGIAGGLGYMGSFIVPGGSMVEKIIGKYRPKAVVGVSCFPEMELAMTSMKSTSITPIGVILLKDGCKDTDVNVEEVREKLGIIDKKYKTTPRQKTLTVSQTAKREGETGY